MSSPPLVIGLDCSTQSISAVVLDAASLRVVHEASVDFDGRFGSAYGVERGVHRGPSAGTVRVPALMLVDALDAIFGELAPRIRLSDVMAIGGCAQQHTSVYWRKGFDLRECMDAAAIALREGHGATTQLAPTLEAAGAFARAWGPSWMDTSTTVQCQQLEADLGGAQRVAAITGSRAYERFTGNQLSKRLQEDAEFFTDTGRVSLASSALTSLLVGDFAAIDASDASGMNLLDLKGRVWSLEILQAIAGRALDSAVTAAALRGLVGDVVAAPDVPSGAIHTYFQLKYGLSATCVVVSFTGDNPSSLVGLGLREPGDVGVSLGTSSTVMAVVPSMDTSSAAHEGHFFLNPIDSTSLMAMICFRNGALAREDVRDRRAKGSWGEFEALLEATPVGNNGIIGFFFRDPEITPTTTRSGVEVFDHRNSRIPISRLSPGEEVRALVESQCLSMRLHGSPLGIVNARRIIVTGGAAVSGGIAQVLANVFQAPVWRSTESVNAAALGGAFRALWEFRGIQGGFDAALDLARIAEPQPAHVAVYDELLGRYAQLEPLVVQRCSLTITK